MSVLRPSAGLGRRSVLSLAWLLLMAAPEFALAEVSTPIIWVEHAADAGPGSLRAAIARAVELGGKQRIELERSFAEGPLTLALERPLPRIEGTHLTIDGRLQDVLWKAYGLTIDGSEHLQLFDIGDDATLVLRGLTLAHGRARQGGAVINRGRLLMQEVTLLSNHAERDGGAVFSLGQEAIMVNVTAMDNQARRGGVIAASKGRLRVTQSTFFQNRATKGAALFSRVPLRLANSILAGEQALQCVNTGTLEEDRGNLVGDHKGCGVPAWRGDPRLDQLGYYNGPSPTLPLDAGSPAINLGVNAAALDIDGNLLQWDQRGNGDPRFVAGYADIGAYEHQDFPHLVVDRADDNGLRACTFASRDDCPLRAALELSAASPKPATITFHPGVFAQARELQLPELGVLAERALILDGQGAARIGLRGDDEAPPAWVLKNGVYWVNSSVRDSPGSVAQSPSEQP